MAAGLIGLSQGLQRRTDYLHDRNQKDQRFAQDQEIRGFGLKRAKTVANEQDTTFEQGQQDRAAAQEAAARQTKAQAGYMFFKMLKATKDPQQASQAVAQRYGAHQVDPSAFQYDPQTGTVNYAGDKNGTPAFSKNVDQLINTYGQLAGVQPTKPVNVPAGGALVDPSTGKPIYQNPAKGGHGGGGGVLPARAQMMDYLVQHGVAKDSKDAFYLTGLAVKDPEKAVMAYVTSQLELQGTQWGLAALKAQGKQPKTEQQLVQEGTALVKMIGTTLRGQPGAAQPGAPQPGGTQPVDQAKLIQQANDAIAAGADPAQVRARLQKMGVNPALLGG